MAVCVSRNGERSLDGSIEFVNFGGVACTHESLQTLARNREDVVEVRDTSDGQPLPPAEDDFGRELANRSGDEYDDDRTNAVENGIPGQDHNGSATHRWWQFGPPHFAALHASPAFQSGIWGNSASNAACVSASWFASTSVMAVASRYCRIASSTSARTSRPCFAARVRSCSSTLPGSSILTMLLYPGATEASTAAGQPGRPSRTSGSTGPLERRGRLAAGVRQRHSFGKWSEV